VADPGSFLNRHYFLLRRLHSLSGILPIGLFLIIHLTTNSSILWGLIDSARHPGIHPGAATFQHEVNFIHSLPALTLIEIFGLWIPIAFHAILGLFYARAGSRNIAAYPYQANRRYVLQRISGYIGFLFIFYHVATLRWGWTWLIPGGTQWKAEYAASTLAAALQGGHEGVTLPAFLVALFYMLGVSLIVFHFANGLWTAAITWGLTISEHAQRRWGYICSALGLFLMAAAWSALLGFLTLDTSAARNAEESLRTPHTSPALLSPDPDAHQSDPQR